MNELSIKNLKIICGLPDDFQLVVQDRHGFHNTIKEIEIDNTFKTVILKEVETK